MSPSDVVQERTAVLMNNYVFRRIPRFLCVGGKLVGSDSRINIRVDRRSDQNYRVSIGRLRVPCYRVEPRPGQANSFTLRCSNSHGCINENMAAGNGGFCARIDSHRALVAEFKITSYRRRDSLR